MGKDYSETANYKIWQLNRKKENATDEVKIKIDLAINLIKLRTKKKLSQIELSKELKVNQKNISQWEKGKVSPSLKYLVVISKFYNVTINELLEPSK